MTVWLRMGPGKSVLCGQVRTVMQCVSVHPPSLERPPQMQALILLQTGGQFLLTALFFILKITIVLGTSASLLGSK